jgi:hypothetical protein
LQERISTIREIPAARLAETTDYLLCEQLGHEAAIRHARGGDLDFSSKEIDERAAALERASSRERAYKSLWQKARRERHPRRRIARLKQLFEAATQDHFTAVISLAAAMEQFNAEWTQLENPSTRQRAQEESGPIVAQARHLMGAFGYTKNTVAKLLTVAGFIKVQSAPALSAKDPGDKDPALDRLLKALSRTR